ncbi:preATP grasp domain-containing protein [Nocardiopsis baichengensis]|uniref:preATP grasp domain-containing protein n=1 Tax=Nocardiopsis baichengensis TaxID=280240 RepID=UPI00034D5CD1|nr:peptide ligase PGM1-related protein [Nocardiopsis baichengensis]
MSRLLIGNDFTEELDGADRAREATACWYAQRTLFFAEDGDTVVLPHAPTDVFLGYVTSLTGTDPASLRIVVPPARVHSQEHLSAERIADPSFHRALHEAIAGRPVDEVVMLYPDPRIVALARALGIGDAVPGGDFIMQSGGALANSKAAFRALASGTGVPVPEGAVCSDPSMAHDVVERLLGAGAPVIVKHEYRQASKGNEILSRHGGVTPRGAPRAVVLPDPESARKHLEAEWDRLTSGGRHRLVVERYFPDSASVFAELLLTDAGVELAGEGELIYAPTPRGQVMPACRLPSGARGELAVHSRRMGRLLWDMGHRGRVSMDAVVTPDGRLFFTEYNGRVTGSTHVYAIVGHRVVGRDYPGSRVLVEHVGLVVPSFESAVARLSAEGLAYDHESRTGVVLVSDLHTDDRDVIYCIVVDDVASAEKYRQRVERLFGDARTARS